ncbi:MAG: hypothetical protein IT450_09785 [Phycisphaerales bacterium]|nr:hypothetical protein [Phycisphaerales bacterium]
MFYYQNERASRRRFGLEYPMVGKRVKQMGAAAFCFFLVKGLVWIAVGVGAIEGCRAAAE